MSRASTLVPSARRRVALRARGDLVARRMSIQGQGCWAVKDPLSLRYFHLRDEEHWVLQQLDGRSSLSSIQSLFAERFAPRRLSLRELQSFVARLYEEGLVVSDAPDQGDQLRKKALRERRRRLLQAVANPLAIRFRGIDPDRFLSWLLSACGWMFSPWFLAGCVLLIVGALALVA